MRYDAEHKARTRTRILKEAGKAIRAEGPHRVGVAGVMEKAGLTHGGFYAHFASKDDLIAQAIAFLFEEAQSQFLRGAEGRGDREVLSAYVDFYLSAAHRDTRERGCPLPSLSADLPRLSAPAREGFDRGLAALTDLLSIRLAALGRSEPQALARSALAEMVGALALSRAVADPARSDEILETTRRAVRARLGLEQA